MKNYIKAVVLAIALVSCTEHTEEYTPTRNDKTFTMVVNYMQPEEVATTCKALGLEEVNGCAKFNLDTFVCNIYVAPQRYANDSERLEIIGHETDHCVHGRWHK